MRGARRRRERPGAAAHLSSSRSRGADGGDVELREAVAQRVHVRNEADVVEPGRLHRRAPVLGREEAAVGAPDGVQHGRPERLEQIEDELGVDGLLRHEAHALGDDERAARGEGVADLAEREVEVAGDVQGVDRVDERHAAGRDALLGERTVHVQGGRAHERRLGEAALDRRLAAPQPDATITADTRFSWSSPSGGPRTFLWHAELVDDTIYQGIFVATARTEITLPSFGNALELPPRSSSIWSVETHGDLPDVDAMTGPEGFLDAFSIPPQTYPYGPRRGAGSYTDSVHSAFTMDAD